MVRQIEDLADAQFDAPRTSGAPRFLITIDTEGDKLWDRPLEITTRNAENLPRFQRLCETYGFKPTYLTNYEMVISKVFQEFGRDVLRRGTGEIGMHLHAWNMPFGHRLTDDDLTNMPYLIDYGKEAIRDMVSYMTDLLAETFGKRPISHRAGRWAMNEVYASALIDNGYRVDCSVTPHVSWRGHPGDPVGFGGTDYSDFPTQAYFVNTRDISRHGKSDLLEVPMTIMPCLHRTINVLRDRLASGSLLHRALNHFFPPVRWLRPNGENLNDMLAVVSWAIREGYDYIEFMLHSSELMAGGSRRFATKADIDNLYDHMEKLFDFISKRFVGATLMEYRESFTERS
jgi:hypothetical protein